MDLNYFAKKYNKLDKKKKTKQKYIIFGNYTFKPINSTLLKLIYIILRHRIV